jgi:hypothetical protein
LQEFFLNNYKIIAIVESKVERWFEEADINTCIVILQKCSNKTERDNNIVRFAYLKKRLAELIPPADDSWEQEVSRMQVIDSLRKTILAHSELYENDDMRIYPKLQKDLWDEGCDPEEEKYTGAKWGKYLRAPDIFFKIMEKGKDKFIPLKEIANIRRGFTTGANEFFYLTEEDIKRWRIEKEYWMHKDKKGKWIPNYVIKSPRECKSIIVNPKALKFRVLMIHDDIKKLTKKRVMKYIKYGEDRKFNERETFVNRKRWYDLGIWKKPDLIWSDAYLNKYIVVDAEGKWADKRFFYIYLHKKIHKKQLLAYLNSTLISLFIEIDGIKNLGEGAIYTNVYQLKKLNTIFDFNVLSNKKINPIIKNLKRRNIKTIFEELNAIKPDEININRIIKDRFDLDKIILCDILGLTEEEQLEVYKAVIDLVKSRIERARSLDNNNKLVEGIHLDSFSDNIVNDFKGEQ